MQISFSSRSKARSFNAKRNASGEHHGKVIDKGPQAVKDGKSISRYAVSLSASRSMCNCEVDMIFQSLQEYNYQVRQILSQTGHYPLLSAGEIEIVCESILTIEAKDCAAKIVQRRKIMDGQV